MDEKYKLAIILRAKRLQGDLIVTFQYFKELVRKMRTILLAEPVAVVQVVMALN